MAVAVAGEAERLADALDLDSQYIVVEFDQHQSLSAAADLALHLERSIDYTGKFLGDHCYRYPGMSSNLNTSLSLLLEKANFYS